MNFKHYFMAYILSVIAVFVIAFAGNNDKPIETNETSDAYVYIPMNEDVTRDYTDIKMFDCSWCHRRKNLNRHHIIPQSADPSLKNVNSNIVVLCRDCHFVLGHRCNWKQFNPDVMTIVNNFTNSILSSEYLSKSRK